MANCTGLSASSDEEGSSSFESSDPSVASELRAIGARSTASNHSDAEDKKPSGRRTPIRDLPSAASTNTGTVSVDNTGGNPRRFFSSPNSAAKAVEQEEQQRLLMLQQHQRHQQHMHHMQMQQNMPQFMHPHHPQMNAQPQYAHPQPQHQLNREQMAQWISQSGSGNVSARHKQFLQQSQGPTGGKGALDGHSSPERHHRYSSGSGSRAGSDKTHSSSVQTGSLMYSDDEDDILLPTAAAAAAGAAVAAAGGKMMSSGSGTSGISGGGDNSGATGDNNGVNGANGANGSNLGGEQKNGTSQDTGNMTRGVMFSPHLSERTAMSASEPMVPGTFKVYWRRWLMLLYMSLLNLMSDWTCYSVAPIALLTVEAFGDINPETLVTIFLGANAVASAAEPMILGRLGLRGTVVLGSLLLMVGSIIKSGGMPLFTTTPFEKGTGAWKLYLGFFLVGLSQPLYQCTPALLSASWFPEKERTMATGVALNSNQLGIGCAFVFGTLLVETSDDIPSYFGLMSLISTIAFIGSALQFDDAPPTPPSDSARVIRGTFEMKIPSMRDMIWKSAPAAVNTTTPRTMQSEPDTQNGHESTGTSKAKHESRAVKDTSGSSSSRQRRQVKSKIGRDDSDHSLASRGSRGSRRSGHSASSDKKRSSRSGDKSRSSTSRRSSRENRHSSGSRSRPRRHHNSGSRSASSENGLRAPPTGAVPSSSPALDGPTAYAAANIASEEERLNAWYSSTAPAPSPMMPGAVGGRGQRGNYPTDQDESLPPPSYQNYQQQPYPYEDYPGGSAPPMGHAPLQQAQYSHPSQIPPHLLQQARQGEFMAANSGPTPEMKYANYQYGSPLYSTPPGMPYQMNDYIAGYPPPFNTPPPMYFDDINSYYYQQQFYYPGQYFHPDYYQMPKQVPNLPPLATIDEGAEPVMTLTPHHLDIDIRDDQIILSAKACFSRPGFVHAVVAFTASGIVINTLSTYMDYLVGIAGGGRQWVGIVGGTFQALIMIASLIFGGHTDRTRAYYSVAMFLLVAGAFALAECGVTLDAARGGDLRWALLVVAVLVGPLQPVSTELGVDVAYPLSENTVLVIQQLFSNLLSALFIPFFKAVRNIGTVSANEMGVERPQYTFSFYLLIVVHACATVFFATFNGRYLRLEAELAKKSQQEREAQARENGNVSMGGTGFRPGSFQPVKGGNAGDYAEENERLLNPPSIV
uniref:Major facilitator superfamily (MFS) profile domain-containing protein n=1 Tax=Ditylum brightwellii TaxID=49249 RepID=A0A7S4RSP2_9STRA